MEEKQIIENEQSPENPPHQPLPYGAVRPDLYPPKSPPPEKPPVVRNDFQQKLQNHFERYGLFSLLMGVLGVFCFFRNPSGITYPVFVAAAYGGAYRILPTLGIPIKGIPLFLTSAALLLGINSCTTASPAIHHLNTWAQILLGTIFLLHQCYDDRTWNIGSYFKSILKFWLHGIYSLPLPFLHGTAFVKQLKSRKSKNILMAFAGVLAGIPAVLYLASLLARADAVFQFILQRLILDLFHPRTIFQICLMLVLFFLTAYCLLGSTCAMDSAPNGSGKAKRNPMAAISFTFMIAVLYVFFCLIQIVYLFGRKSGLPDHMSYSQYARQGFFQLLFVAVLNLILVLNCLKYFQHHKVLSLILVIISLCTYVMIASAVYRMLLYVSVYSLTFLRLFVLWFLGLISILMLGVLILIFRETFPLFRWCLISITLAYTAFAWIHPDYQIARYNIAQEGGQITSRNVGYLISELSADAAPAIVSAEISPEILDMDLHLYHAYDQRPGIRTYNFSTAKAWRLTQNLNP